MKTWKCSFNSLTEEGKEEIVEVEFLDYEDVTQKSIILKSSYFDKLIEKSKINEKYSLSGGLVKLIDPEGKDLTSRSFYAILGIDPNNLMIGILIGELNENDYKYVAFYPPSLKNELTKDVNALRGLPVLLLDYENNWTSVNIIAPSPS